MAGFVPETMTLEEVRAAFDKDIFATQLVGAQITEVSRGHAKTELVLRPDHYNASGGVMGGAIFTLADLCLAAASNFGEEPTVSVSNTIEYMTGSRGTKLYAECNADKSGKHLGFYTVEVTDDLGKRIAKMTATCYR